MPARFEPGFLRLVREFRNQRRIFATRNVAADAFDIAYGGPLHFTLTAFAS